MTVLDGKFRNFRFSDGARSRFSPFPVGKN